MSISTVVNALPERLPSLSPELVLKAGAAGLPQLASSPDELVTLQEIWNKAVSRTMILSAAVLALSVPFTLGMEWLNAKTVAAAQASEAEGRSKCELSVLSDQTGKMVQETSGRKG